MFSIINYFMYPNDDTLHSIIPKHSISSYAPNKGDKS